MSEKDEQLTQKEEPAEVEGHVLSMDQVERPASRPASRSDEDETPDFEGHMVYAHKGRPHKGRPHKGRA